MSKNNANNAQLIQVPLGSITADANTLAGWIPSHMKLKSAKLVNLAAIAQSDSNYVALSVKIGSTVLASFSTQLTGGNGALADGVPVSMVLAADPDIPAGSKLEVAYDETGTIAMTTAHVVLELYPL